MRREKICCKKKETRVVENPSFTIQVRNAFDSTRATIKAGNVDVSQGNTRPVNITVGEPLYIWLEGDIPESNRIWFRIEYQSSYSGTQDNYSSEINRTYDKEKKTPQWEIKLNSLGNRGESANDLKHNTTANVTVGDIE